MVDSREFHASQKCEQEFVNNQLSTLQVLYKIRQILPVVLVRKTSLPLEAERKKVTATLGRVEALGLQIATVKARAEAQGQVQVETAERLKRVETELSHCRAGESKAREEAAQLRGRAESLQAQHAQLMQALTLREGERLSPKGKK